MPSGAKRRAAVEWQTKWNLVQSRGCIRKREGERQRQRESKRETETERVRERRRQRETKIENQIYYQKNNMINF